MQIKTILPKGGGFIKGEDGADIFFSKGDFHGNPNNLIIDMSVQYNVKDSYDKKKKKKSKSAYNIKNIERGQLYPVLLIVPYFTP